MVSPINEPGFLTRIVKRIREATHEVLQSEGAGVPAEASEEAVKVQKRKDNAIRRREFNHLRQVRAMRLKAHPDMVVRMSVFQNSSTFNSDGRSIRGRAKTVGKIDAIEAELAQQWWANSNAEGASTNMPAGTSEFVPSTRKPNQAPEKDSELDLDFTGLAQDAKTPEASSTSEYLAPALVAPTNIPTLPMQDALGAALDLFDQGNFDQAESALVALLQSPQLNDETAEACSATLLNLYRATGARSSFDTVAIEYAQLFGRSAPEWRATVVGDAQEALVSTAHWPQPHQSWECPAVLGPVDMVALQALANTAAVTEFDWTHLVAVDVQAAQPLLAIFSQWAMQPLVLHFQGLNALHAALAAAAPSNARLVDPVWWQLRLAMLRVCGMQSMFDDVAMEYCVTYEISPPTWTAPHCSLAPAV